MKKRILAFGDSNTWGADPSDGSRYGEDVRWTGVMARELGEGYTVIEEGYNGRTSVWDDPVEGRLSGIKYFYPCLDSQSPLDLVIIMLGTNDMKARFHSDGRSIAYGLGRYLDAIRMAPMAGEKPKVLIASPILIREDYKKNPLFYDMFGDGAVERSRKLAEAYQEFAKNNGAWYINAAAYGTASDVDGVHMEPESHEKLGRAFAEKVKEILQ